MRRGGPRNAARFHGEAAGWIRSDVYKRQAIEDANDIGHFFLIMEHKGYEIKHRCV